LSLNLPDTQVSDIWVEANAIAIATHGRGFYVLDDIAALRQQADAAATTQDFHLFKPADAIRSGGGAPIAYVLKRPPQKLTVEILDGFGKPVQTIEGKAEPAGGRGTAQAGGRGATAAPAAESAQPEEAGGGRGRGAPPTASMAAGLNRVTWNLEYPGPVTFPGMVLWGATTSGPAALPGTYQVRLTVDGKSQTQTFAVRKHPFHEATDAELKEQFELSSAIRDKVSEANNAVIQIRKIKDQVKERLAKSSDAALKAAGDKLTADLSEVEEAIYQVKNQSNQDPLNFPIKINNRLASLLAVVQRGDGKPIAIAYPLFKDLSDELKVQSDRLQQVLTTDLVGFNTEAKRAGLEAVGQPM
jgi:hypothetical protein